HRPSGLAAPGGVARAGDLVAETLVRVLLQGATCEPLLVAKLDPAQVEDRLLHGDLDTLSTAGVRALVQRGQNPRDEVDSGTRVTDLSTGRHRRPVLETRGCHRAAHRLRDDFVGFEVEVLAWTESLDGR